MQTISLKNIVMSSLALSLSIALFSGCQSSEKEEQINSTKLTKNSVSSTKLDKKTSNSLIETLSLNAQSMSEEEFIIDTLDAFIPNLAKRYVPSSYEDKVLLIPALQTKNLVKNIEMVSNLKVFYNLNNAEDASTQRAFSLENLAFLFGFIVVEVKNSVVAYLFPDSTIHSQTISNDINMSYKLMGDGNITIIFESGAGGDISSWKNIQPEISKYTKTLSYDRTGLGKSTSSDEVRSCESINTQLHELLEAIGLEPPYIFVGHSYGGIFTKTFVEKYPNEVIGQVYVDATDTRYFEKILEYRNDEQKAYIAQSFDITSDYGWYIDLVRLYNPDYLKGILAELTPTFAKQVAQDFNNSTFSGTIATSMLVNAKVAVERVNKLNPLPLLEKDTEVWINLHKEWLIDMPQSRFILLENSGHFIQDTEPEILIDEIKTVLEEASSL